MNGIICGNCKSGMIYQDYIPGLPGDHGRACMKCGNREPNGKFIQKAAQQDGKEETLKKGTCTNCNRPHMGIYNAAGHCSSCHEAQKGLTGDEREKALAKAKDILCDPNNRCVVNHAGHNKMIKETSNAPAPTADIIHADVIAKGDNFHAVTHQPITKLGKFPQKAFPAVDMEAHGPGSQALMTLLFNEDIDLEVYEYILAEAKRLRRTPEQQVLWILQMQMPKYQGREEAAHVSRTWKEQAHGR